jgi:hypothetical protein
MVAVVPSNLVIMILNGLVVGVGAVSQDAQRNLFAQQNRPEGRTAEDRPSAIDHPPPSITPSITPLTFGIGIYMLSASILWPRRNRALDGVIFPASSLLGDFSGFLLFLRESGIS